MQEATMATMVILLGLVLVGLLVQTLNQVRLVGILRDLQRLEDRILAHVVHMETKAEANASREDNMDQMMEGSPVTLEDLIRLDMLEQASLDPDQRLSNQILINKVRDAIRGSQDPDHALRIYPK